MAEENIPETGSDDKPIGAEWPHREIYAWPQSPWSDEAQVWRRYNHGGGVRYVKGDAVDALLEAANKAATAMEADGWSDAAMVDHHPSKWNAWHNLIGALAEVEHPDV